MVALFALAVSSLASLAACQTFQPWSPSGRHVTFAAVQGTEGNVTTPWSAITEDDRGAKLSGVNATLALDAGRMIAGSLSFKARAQCHGQHDKARVGVAFAEAPDFIGRASDLSHSLQGGLDGALNASLGCDWQVVTFAPRHIRGSFRYVTLFVQEADVEVKAVGVHFDASPDVADDQLQNYTGFFHSSDSLLNRIYYAGVYTLQLNRIGAHTGRAHDPAFPELATGWDNSAPFPPLDSSDVVLVDGAKRDRTVWPGDYAIAVASTFVSQNVDDMASITNGLRTLVAEQNDTVGLFPYAGPPISTGATSDTYHLWTLNALYDAWSYTGTSMHWSAFKRGLEASLAKIDDGLFNVTLTSDWGRLGSQGHTSPSNMLLYGVLQKATVYASALGHDADAQYYSRRAADLQRNITSRLWDSDAKAYRDNTSEAGGKLHPQDGNSLALLFNVEHDQERRSDISRYLDSLSNEYGPVSPEGAGIISPFISGLTLDAHFYANQNAAAYRLMRLLWGYMLQRFSNSTLIEGFYKDGSLFYPFYGNLDSYISHAHAWSTGPVSSLIRNVVGLTNVTVAGQSGWVFEPAILNSDLDFAQGGFEVPKLGSFAANWSASPLGESYSASITAPKGLPGTLLLELPASANMSRTGVSVYLGEYVIMYDGQLLKEDASFVDASKKIKVPVSGRGAWQVNVIHGHGANYTARATEPSRNREVRDASSYA
ncbi:unnamed protein product [Jaminaea pallidilutea]